MHNGGSKTETVVVFSGGSAANSLVDVFDNIVQGKGCMLSYIVPISDNGGSSSEIMRVFGGPGIGDIRSRLVRLIPDAHSQERTAIKTLFNHRLAADAGAARTEWLDIVEARHPLWHHISSEKKELIRSFLNVLNLEIVKRARPTSVFNFESASIGNMFLTGARLFTGSFESAIYLLSNICCIAENIAVLPAINTNFSHHICAILEDETVIAGQNAISHPSEATAMPTSSMGPDHTAIKTDPTESIANRKQPSRKSIESADAIEDANWPGSLPVLRKPYIKFTKIPAATPGPDHTRTHGDNTNAPRVPDDLPSPIRDIYYINPYGAPILPPPNPKLATTIAAASTIIYSIGSLYTSLAPSLILRGVGDAIRQSGAMRKILILNGTIDRETCSISRGAYSGMDFVHALVRAAEQGAHVAQDEDVADDTTRGKLNAYVTHVICIEEQGAPSIDRAAFVEAGIAVVRVDGRKSGSGEGWLYDEAALTQALKALVGSRDGKSVSTRNTMLP